MKKTVAAIASFVLTSVLLASAAGAAGGFGHVAFANSGAPAAQADFQQGMALLHDFEYASAAAAFRRAEAADPGFAMAFWGEAMTYNHPVWMQQDRDAAMAALKKLGPTPAARRAKAKSEREKGYLDAVEILYGGGDKQARDLQYEQAMRKLHETYPDDVDAAAFYGLSILGTAHAGRDVATYMRAAGVLEEAWVDHHEHPGLVHYLIHCYDDPAHAPLGLRMARIYARIAPDAGHAQHMTSHIFLALGMWRECVDANVNAIAAVDRMRKEAGKSPVRCGHYPSWLAYAYLQLGMLDDARRGLDSCNENVAADAAEDHPGHAMDPDESLSGSLANMRLRYLIDTGDWAGSGVLDPAPASTGPGGRLDLAFGRVLAEIGRGRTAEAKAALDSLGAIGRVVAEIETKDADPDPTYRVRPQIFLLEGQGLLAEQQGAVAQAESFLRQAVDLEQTLPIAFGPPTIDKPTHELLAEFLLRQKRYDEAKAEFEKALARTPKRRLAEEGLKEATAGINRVG